MIVLSSSSSDSGEAEHKSFVEVEIAEAVSKGLLHNCNHHTTWSEVPDDLIVVINNARLNSPNEMGAVQYQKPGRHQG